MWNSYILSVFVTLFSISVFSQSIPNGTITPVCDGQSITQGAPGNTGIYTLTIPCNTSQPLSPFMDFYFVKILSGTTFTFKVTPIGQDDYDFGAYLNPNWDNIAATPTANKRGSQNDPFQTMTFHLGLSLTATDLCETGGSTGIPEPGMVRYFDVQPNDEILIAIDRWSNTTDGYTIEFGGDAILDCTILGNSYGKCDIDKNGSESFVASDFLPDLNTDFPNHNFKFYSTQAAAEAGSGAQVTFPLTVNYNGGNPTELFARVETLAGGFVRVVKLFLFVNPVPDLINETVELPLQCDEDGDGEAIFNLIQSQILLVTNPLTYTFKYYLTEADAIAGGTNYIPNPNTYTSGNATIYVRIETGPVDGNDEGCFSLGKVLLKVSDFNVEEQIINIDSICDADGDGNIVVDLTENITQIVPNPADYQISYHTTLENAEWGLNPINPATAYTISAGTNVTIFVRIHSLTDPCYSISRLNYTTVERPILISVDDFSLCVDQWEGNYNVDLTQFAAQIVNNPANYTISYYTNQADAELPQNPIANPAAYPTLLNTEITIFIRVEADGCHNIGSVKISINSNPFLNDNLEINSLCDLDGDGTVIVDLTETIPHFTDNPADFVISYHNSQQEAELGDNPIINPTNYPITAGQTIVVFIRVKSNTTECYSVRSITYQTLERPVLIDLDDVNLCVDQTTGNYNYDLTSFNNLVVANPQNFTITFHQNLTDANSGDNQILPANAYPIPVNSSVTVFVRVANGVCYDIQAVEITINSNPEVTDLPSQAFCSTAQTGTIPYDLTQHQNEWVTDFNLYNFSYHTSQQNANTNQSPILTPTNYMIPVGATTTIFVRIENNQTGCFKTTILTLFPGATATLNDDLAITLCDEDFDGFYTYSLSDLNPQLVAITTGLVFAYYLTEQNALADTNPIPQAQWNNYQMSTLPLNIWVVATTTDSCRSIPVKVTFDAGVDIPLLTSVIGPVKYCMEDEINLPSYENDMTNENAIFSYHYSLSDAQNELNPIANTTQFHPQGNNSVFVRLEQTDRCSVLVEIKFELLPTPSIEVNQSTVELCPGDSFEIMAVSDDSNASFAWYLNDVEIGTGDHLVVTENGLYTVIVTGMNGCVNETNVTVVSPASPTITGIEMGQNSILVSASAGGSGGILEFSLDKVFWQSSPKFENLIPGETYTIYVRQAGCMIDSYKLTLLFITNFISPNGDGKNDSWEVRGIEVTPDATIKIFDRYGKIFVDTNFEGNYMWDGKYLGRTVPSGDYWYIMNVPGDGIIKPQKFMGHISVRNK